MFITSLDYMLSRMRIAERRQISLTISPSWRYLPFSNHVLSVVDTSWTIFGLFRFGYFTDSSWLLVRTRACLKVARKVWRRRCKYNALDWYNILMLYFPNVNYFNLWRFVFSIDPFTRKDWYNVRAPCMFTNRDVGKTLVNRTQGTSECYELFFSYTIFYIYL